MQLSNQRKNLIYFGCCLLTATVMLSSMGLNNTMFAILTQMNGLQYYSLMAVLSGFGTSIMCLIGTNLGMMYGNRIMSLIGAAIALICMIMMGLTKSLFVFIVARALLSFGIGTFTALPFVICAMIFDQEKYTARVGFLGSIMALTTLLGSVIAGLMVDRGMVALSIIYPGICAFTGALIVFFAMPKETPIPQKIDLSGMLLLSILLAAFSYAFTFASSLGFGHWSIVLGYIVTVAAAIALYQVEKKKEQPLIPFRLFRNLKFTGCCISVMLLSIYMLTMGIYVPITGQAIMHTTAAMTGMFSLGRTILAIVLPLILAAWANKAPGNMRIGMILASICATVPFVFFAFTGVTEGYKGVCSTPLVVRQLEPQDIGIGIGLFNTCGSLSATFAMPILGAVYDKLAQTSVSHALGAAYWITAAVGLASVFICIFLLKEKKAA